MGFAQNRFALHFKRYFLQFCKVKKTAHGVCGSLIDFIQIDLLQDYMNILRF